MIDLHEKFQEYGKNAKYWLRQCALLLPEIDRKKIWKKKGFSSIFEYTSKLAGMSHHQVRETLRVMKRLKDKPALKKVVEEKGINAVRPVAVIATQEDQEFWAEKAREMSVHALETYVREVRKSHHVETFQVRNELMEKLIEIKGNRTWDETIEELIQLKLQQNPERRTDATRHIPQEIKKAVESRSKGKCEFNGCHKSATLFHHADRFAYFKTHDSTRIFHLCKGHERLCHLGLIANEDLSIQHWQIRQTAVINTIDAKVQEYYRPPP